MKTMNEKERIMRKGMGIEDMDKACAVPYVIDTNKRTAKNREPRFTE